MEENDNNKAPKFGTMADAIQHQIQLIRARQLRDAVRSQHENNAPGITPAPRSKIESEAAARLLTQELQEVKSKLIEAEIIVDGRWAKQVSDFACLATELKETFGIVAEHKQNGKHRYAWIEYCLFAGFPVEKKESARGCSLYNQHSQTANRIRAICREVHEKYVK